MILIADSGSTKTAWRLLLPDGQVKEVASPGINPNYQTTEEILLDLQTNLLQQLGGAEPAAIYFYGAGCANEAKCAVVAAALKTIFPGCREVQVVSDVIGAARGACGHEPGIACILGTGSNSCLFDGEKIITQMPCLGFTLGDEGSGSYLGRQLLSLYLNNELPEPLQAAFREQYPSTQAEILHKIYNEPFPKRFIASFSRFLSGHIAHPFVHDLVKQSFLNFFKLTVCKYENYQNLPTHVVGSVGYYFADILREAAAEKNIRIGNIFPSPIDGLIRYHQKR